jgi:hypothetical protein
MTVQQPEIPRRRLLRLGAAIGVAALALLLLAGACTEEEELGEDTPTPQHTQTATATPSRTATPISSLTPEPTLTSEPTKGVVTEVTQEPIQETPQATQTPEATPTTEAPTPTPQIALEFPDIPAAPEGLSGEDSLADLMSYLDSVGGVIETKDFLLSEAFRPPELKRIGFAIQIRKPGGIWQPGDETEFEQKRDDFLRWFAERRNLAGADCGCIVFSAPRDATMLFTEVDRTVRCPEDTLLDP